MIGREFPCLPVHSVNNLSVLNVSVIQDLYFHNTFTILSQAICLQALISLGKKLALHDAHQHFVAG